MGEIRKIRRWYWLALIIGTFVLCLSCGWNALQSWNSFIDEGKSEGRMAFRKDLSYRIWNAAHGGVYVPVTSKMQPNPYLKVPHRDIETTDGKKLTLVNPAFMTRQVFVETEELYGIKGHITSKILMNPINLADKWEQQCLKNFEKDHSEVTQYMYIDGKPYLRFMRPMITQKTCLKCHAHMGYKVGDVRGGISVSVPMKGNLKNTKNIILNLIIAHIILLILGLVALTFSKNQIIKHFSKKQQAEIERDEDRERLAITMRSIGEGVITTDIDSNIVLMNKVAEDLTGWMQAEATGKNILEVFNIINKVTGKPCETPITKRFDENNVIGLANSKILVAKNGAQFSIEDSVAPIFDNSNKMVGAVIVFRDVTADQKIAEELMKIEKLGAVGVLAGGIAHDFNNILTAILGNIELAQLFVKQPEKIGKVLEQSRKASIRAKALTTQLLTFSKGGDPVCQFSPIDKIITDTADFALRGSSISCEYDFPTDLWEVNIDTGQIAQVIQNIIMNARHAMTEGGKIQVDCQNIDNKAQELALKCDKYVKLTIADSGSGIPAKFINQIFDPYFTTKNDGDDKGNGLGLSICYSIINKHKGHIEVKSEANKGTTFTIYLPAFIEPRKIMQKHIQPNNDTTDKTTIMVMDDETMILDFAKLMLESSGHEVVFANNGEEAIKIYNQDFQDTQSISIIIMDLIISEGMGGEKAIKEILKINPDAKVIVASGYANDPIIANHQNYGFVASISKPYQIEEITQLINKFLV